MWFGIVSLFPEMFDIATQAGVLGRAVTQGVVNLEVFNPREFVTDKHRTVDDRPYGGGPGMVMMVEPLTRALQAARKVAADRTLDAPVVYLSPQGDRLDQRKVVHKILARQFVVHEVRGDNVICAVNAVERLHEYLRIVVTRVHN